MSADKAIQNSDLSDHLAIQALVAGYSDAVNRRCADDWGQCWAEDAVWQLGAMELRGKDQIIAGWRTAMGRYTHVWFSAFIGHMDFTGHEARLRTHTFEYLRPVDGQPKLQAGLYQDHVIREKERWVFAARIFQAQELPL